MINKGKQIVSWEHDSKHKYVGIYGYYDKIIIGDENE